MSERKCDEKDCKLMAYHLSSMAEKLGNDVKTGEPMYNQTLRWKCLEGHQTFTKRVIRWSEMYPPKVPTVDYSIKRYRRKGFKAHIVKAARVSVWRNDGLTNHQRMLNKVQQGFA